MRGESISPGGEVRLFREYNFSFGPGVDGKSSAPYVEVRYSFTALGANERVRRAHVYADGIRVKSIKIISPDPQDIIENEEVQRELMEKVERRAKELAIQEIRGLDYLVLER